MAIERNQIVRKEALEAPLLLADNLLKVVKSLEKVINTGKRADKTLNLAKNTRQVATETKKLTIAEKELVKQNKEIVKINSRLNPQYQKQQKQLARLRAEQQKVNTSMRQQAQRAAGVKGGFSRLGGVLSSTLLRFAGIAAVITGVFKLFRSGINIIKNYTSANSTLNGILNKTSKETAKLRKQQKQLGASTVFSATQVTKAQTELAKLGLEMEQITALTPAILDSAVAMGVDLAEAAELVAGQLNAFGLAASEGTRVSDVLTKATQISAFNFERLKVSLGVVSPAAKAVGASLEDTVAIMSAAVDANIDASTAATGLRNIFIELGNQGVSWNEAMAKINNSTDKLNTANKLFGKRGAVVASVIADNTDKINKNTKALKNASEGAGAAADFAAKQLDNLEGDTKLLTSAWEGFVLSVDEGNGIISQVFRGLIQFLTAVLTGLNKINVEFGGKDFFGTATERLIKFNIKLNDLIGLQNALIKAFQAGAIPLERFIKDNEQLEAAIGRTRKTIRELEEELNPVIDLMPVVTESFKDNKSAVDKNTKSLKIFSKLLKIVKNDVDNLKDSLTGLVNETFDESNKTRDLRLELEALNKAFKDGSISQEDFIKKSNEIKDAIEGNGDVFRDSVEGFKEGFDRLQEEGDRQLDALAEQFEKEEELRKEAAKRAKEIEKAKNEALLDLQSQLFGTTVDVLSNLGEAQSIQFEVDLQNLQDKEDREISQIEDAQRRRGESAEAFAVREMEVEQRKENARKEFALRREQLERNQARANRRRAIFEKVLAATEIAINTARAVVKTIAASPVTAGLPFSAIVAAIGAAQLAAVLTKPIPAFASGTTTPHKGLAVVNELGQERITDRFGRSRIINTDGPTLTYLDNETVSTARETAGIMNSSAMSGIDVVKPKTKTDRELIMSLDRNFNRLQNTIKGQKGNPGLSEKQLERVIRRNEVWDELRKGDYY